MPISGCICPYTNLSLFRESVYASHSVLMRRWECLGSALCTCSVSSPCARGTVTGSLPAGRAVGAQGMPAGAARTTTGPRALIPQVWEGPEPDLPLWDSALAPSLRPQCLVCRVWAALRTGSPRNGQEWNRHWPPPPSPRGYGLPSPENTGRRVGPAPPGSSTEGVGLTSSAPPPARPRGPEDHHGTGGARSRRPAAGRPGRSWERSGCSRGHRSTGPPSPAVCR